jgi:methylated-DNA-[protein]-cysteine S-methyltransferase
MPTSIYRPVLAIPTAALLEPFPDLLIRSDERGRLTELLFIDEGAVYPPEVEPKGNLHILGQLDDYFRGTLRNFDLELAPVGTEFQRVVWKLLCGIPYGETRTYRDIAVAAGNPAATRAVGAANGANPISIVQPCHRVIGSNGKLTGFGGGLPAKASLLALERGGY